MSEYDDCKEQIMRDDAQRDAADEARAAANLCSDRLCENAPIAGFAECAEHFGHGQFCEGGLCSVGDMACEERQRENLATDAGR